jgi:hypothetical protein
MVYFINPCQKENNQDRYAIGVENGSIIISQFFAITFLGCHVASWFKPKLSWMCGDELFVTTFLQAA